MEEERSRREDGTVCGGPGEGGNGDGRLGCSVPELGSGGRERTY